MKKKKGLKWLVLLAVIGIVIFTGFQVVKHEGYRFNNFNMTSMMNSQQQPTQGTFQRGQTGQGQFQGGNQPGQFQANGPHHKGMHQEGMMHQGGFGHHERWFGGFSILPFFLALGSILVGWLLWRGADHGPRKWIGLLLIALGALPSLPILLIAAAIYWLYKKFKNKNDNLVSDEYTSTQPVKQPDYLDEWERNIKKEEK